MSLPIDDLKRYRLVNKFWANVGFVALRHRTFINLHQADATKLNDLLTSFLGSRFAHFNFNVIGWNEQLSEYLSNINPSSLTVHLNDNDPHISEKLTDLLIEQCDPGWR